MEDVVSSGLKADDFSSLRKEIFDAILCLYQREYPIDDTFVKNELAARNNDIKSNELDNEIIEILTQSPISNLKAYIKELRDEREKNNILNSLKQTMEPTLPLAEIKLALYNALNHGDENSLEYPIVTSFSQIEAKNVEVVCKNYLPLPLKTASLIVAEADTGKTYLALKAALKYKIEQIKEKTFNKAICWFTEDSDSILKYRIEELIENSDFREDEKKLLRDEKYEDMIQLCVDLPYPFLTYNEKIVKPTIHYYQAREKFKHYQLLICDPLGSFHLSKDENDNAMARRFMNLMTSWASKDNKAIAFLHHTPHKSDKSRGATALRDASKYMIKLKKPRDEKNNLIESEQLECEIDKDNYKIRELCNIQKKFNLAVFPKKNQNKQVTINQQKIVFK